MSFGDAVLSQFLGCYQSISQFINPTVKNVHVNRTRKQYKAQWQAARNANAHMSWSPK